jgi:hypothetical protein
VRVFAASKYKQRKAGDDRYGKGASINEAPLNTGKSSQ